MSPGTCQCGQLASASMSSATVTPRSGRTDRSSDNCRAPATPCHDHVESGAASVIALDPALRSARILRPARSYVLIEIRSRRRGGCRVSGLFRPQRAAEPAGRGPVRPGPRGVARSAGRGRSARLNRFAQGAWRAVCGPSCCRSAFTHLLTCASSRQSPAFSFAIALAGMPRAYGDSRPPKVA